MNHRIPELLAPAGSPDALRAAVNAGADAVYIGGKQFGARASAPNFTDDELSAGISYAHLRGARVYVTVNTLVHDRELPALARYLVLLYSMGADGILLQDAGAADLARRLVPDLSRHASTQCTITDGEGVMHAREAGFSRVVLARELGMAEIDAIFEIPGPERPGIEIFSHGALCYAYSGQCLLSSVIGGRSGNRGMCAQPCRKPYRLVTGKTDRFGRIHGVKPVTIGESFLLSTRDLCLYPKLREVLERPFAALKIEGRMRSPEYVAIVVSRYRKALDSLAAGSFVPLQEEIEDLEVAFSRGFTTGYLFGDTGPALMGRCRPGNRGLFLGSVVSARSGELRVVPAARTIPGPGDGLVGRDPVTGEEQGFILRGAGEWTGRELVFRQQTGVRRGMDLFLTRSARLEREAAMILQAAGPPGRFPLTIDITLIVEPGLPLLISGTIHIPGGTVLTVRHEGDVVPEPARERPTTGKDIARQIRKTGESAFRVGEFSLVYAGGLFIPVGKLNAFRREFLDLARQAVLAARRPGPGSVLDAEVRMEELAGELSRPVPGPAATLPRLAVICDDAESTIAALAAGCDRVLFEPSGDCLNPGAEIMTVLTGAGIPGAVVWKWPQVPPPGFITRECPALSGLREAGLAGVMVEGPGAAMAIRQTHPGLEVIGGPGLNIFNHRAVRAYRDLFSGITLSPELSLGDIAELLQRKAASCPGMETGVLVQGNLEAMVTADNLFDLVPGGDMYAQHRFGLEDATGRIFPVHVDCSGRSHIANANELCLVDFLPDLAASGVDIVIIDARTRGSVYTRDMTALYREALEDTAWMSGESGTPPPGLKERIRRMARGGITTGHGIRGLAEN
ncbi:MAG: peptidase U32 [Methanomicrobiales archaeon]|nr:peptidase U32 [Methanomicrobiales archaeon]NYT20758.1 peptidase U32 [Methanomicrobiales archaeon]